jgi:hypothetical protein
VAPSLLASSTAVAPPLSSAAGAPSSSTNGVDEASAQAARDAQLGAERALLDMARTAVARGQGEVAFGPLQRHARNFPHGRMAEERDWLWVQALLLTGRTSEARARAARFRAAYPNSLMIPALDRIVPSESPAEIPSAKNEDAGLPEHP